MWKPQPFKQRRPSWCTTHPALADALLSLDDATYLRLFGDDMALQSFLAQYIPVFAQLQELTRLPHAEQPEVETERHLDWAVPGRKWQQIDRFTRAIAPINGAVLEWCGGKGHLGRVLALRNGVSVTTLERDADLCAEGKRLAERAAVQQLFHRVDVLSPKLLPLATGHAVALHACGELHRTLVRKAVVEGVVSLDIAPCCYHLGSGEYYNPFTDDTRLQLGHDDLRLAVTGNVTSSAREVRLRDQEMAWKLGFIALRADLEQDDSYRNLRPVDKSWLKGDFETFCRLLAAREAVGLTADIDWQHYEEMGWLRQREVMRLSLPRHAVRRALELWLVLDMSLALQDHGYEIRLETFCPTYISPRNILLSARRSVRFNQID